MHKFMVIVSTTEKQCMCNSFSLKRNPHITLEANLLSDYITVISDHL